MARRRRRPDTNRAVNLQRLGEQIIDQIASGGLVRVNEDVCGADAHVFIWSANAAEQIEETVRERLRRQGLA